MQIVDHRDHRRLARECDEHPTDGPHRVVFGRLVAQAEEANQLLGRGLAPVVVAQQRSDARGDQARARGHGQLGRAANEIDRRKQRDAVAVGEAAHEDDARLRVDVGEELGDESRLADPGWSDDRDHVAPSFANGRVEDVAQYLLLTLTTGERCVDAELARAGARVRQ